MSSLAHAMVEEPIRLSKRRRGEINALLKAVREPSEISIAREFIMQTFLDHARLSRRDFQRRYDERLIEVEARLAEPRFH